MQTAAKRFEKGTPFGNSAVDEDLRRTGTVQARAFLDVLAAPGETIDESKPQPVNARIGREDMDVRLDVPPEDAVLGEAVSADLGDFARPPSVLLLGHAPSPAAPPSPTETNLSYQW